MQKPVTMPPMMAEGLRHHGAGRLAEAAQCYREALQQSPENPDALLLLGIAARQSGHFPQAFALIRAAIRRRPAPHYFLNLGHVCCEQGSFPAAAAHYRAVLRRQPGHAGAWTSLGYALAKLDRLQEAITCYRRALSLKPGSAMALHGLGMALCDTGAEDEARACLEKALALRPASAVLHNSLGNLNYSRKKMQQAAAHYRRALELNGRYACAHINLGNTLLALGKHAQARSLYESGLALDPASPGARYNLALAQLRNGEFQQGWRNYEARWEFEELHLRRRPFGAPLWRGEPLNGKTILLHAEQGLGDTIQFARYVPLVAARGAQVIVEAQPPLVRLLAQLPGVGKVIPFGTSLPAFDFHCPMMSLPLAFAATVETIPAAEGYLKAASEREARKNAKIRRIGIAWAGNPRHKGDAYRSMPLEALLPLAGVPGLRLTSLQKGPGAEQLAQLKDCLPIEDAASSNADMLETAKLVAALDLVLSVDTSVAHLAGALGKPVWVMLPWVADWRWMERRATSPWYASARLFRQTSAGDWARVVAEITAALRGQKR